MRAEDENVKIKLLICYHKPSKLLKDDIFTPIHVGRALAKKRMDADNPDYQWLMKNMIGDDTGDNISDKNGSYNEMTSLYWAWKNYGELGDPDYIGLMHYRRHFVLREGELDVITFDDMGEHYYEEINYSQENMQKLVKDCDFVAHIGKVNHVYKHYIENHRKEDLDLAFKILYEKYPDYKEIAKEYFEGDYSNFCNMFIMSRELFFDYCEWMFDLLEEFERRVDTSEKRFFISERLTGVYIAKLMKNKQLKYKVVPISFVTEKAKIPIVLPLEKENQFALATTLVSLLANKKPESRYDIYLVANFEVSEKIKKKIDFLSDGYENCNIEYVSTGIKREYYPLVIAGLLPSVNKCIYMEDNSIVLKDLSEFYRICSVDDYYVVGAPLGHYDIYKKEKELNPSFMVINCASLRRHKIMQKVLPEIESGRERAAVLNTVLRGQTGYIPWYLMTLAEETDEDGMFDKNKSRAGYQADAEWKPIVFYGHLLPWENPQGTYSNFWWNIAAKVPAMFEFIPCSLTALEIYFANSQKEINQAAFANPEEGDWRNYSLLGKLKFYYKHNGMKQTIKYAFNRLIGGKK